MQHTGVAPCNAGILEAVLRHADDGTVQPVAERIPKLNPPDSVTRTIARAHMDARTHTHARARASTRARTHARTCARART